MPEFTTADVIRILTELKPRLRDEFGVTKIGFFGSFARNEPDKDSDVDILIETESPLGFEFFELVEVLEDALGKQVDLTTRHGLKKQLCDSILKEVLYV